MMVLEEHLLYGDSYLAVTLVLLVLLELMEPMEM
jgi:hypothetical protein